MIGTISSGISGQLRDVYSICRFCWNIATYKWKVRNGPIEGISFVVKSRYETDLAEPVMSSISSSMG
jgi:hypothetical protein